MKRAALALLAVVAVASGGLLSTASCAQSAVNVPVRTFENAQRVDVVCLRVFAPDPNNPALEVPIPAEPVPQAQCAPVPLNTDGTALPYHLYALVTQTARGEVAVVDLTGGTVIDGDHSTPGINFIPVGQLPTDIAVAADAKMVFVAAAEVNKTAIYAFASKTILGDTQISQGLPVNLAPLPPTLPALPVCKLDQAPGAMVVVPHGDTYELAVVLPGDGVGRKARLVTIDPTPFARGAGVDTTAGPTYPPGELQKCVLTSDITLDGTLPPLPDETATWSDGIVYAVDAAPEPPPPPQGCVDVTDSAPPPPPPADAGADGAPSDAAVTDAAPADADTDAEAGPLDYGPGNAPHATHAARDGTTLYIGDDGLPFIHVVDLSVPSKPKEGPPLVATSLLDSVRKVGIGDIAVSPATSDFKKYLYAVDKKDGSIIVFDVTDAPTAPRGPLTRPHPELNPFQPPDRIIFNTPVAAVSFVRHDFPLTHVCDVAVTNTRGGLFCNPNPNAGLPQGPPVSDQAAGMCYRANATTSDVPALGPLRLRGIFGFITLSNGQVVAIDVDDWDAPCRRPDPMGGTGDGGAGFPSGITPFEPPPSGGTDIDPYHAPVAYQKNAGVATSPVSLEDFFPVSAPHRPRSLYYLRNDQTTGVHAPVLNGVPQLFSFNNALSTNGPAGLGNPLLLPTATKVADPTYITNTNDPNPDNRIPASPAGAALLPPLDQKDTRSPAVRFSWEDPQVQLDQDWTVTYEGPIPGFDGQSLATPVVSTDGYQTLSLTNPNALFCRKGVEDNRLGVLRSVALAAEMQSKNIAVPAKLDKHLGDYVEVTDEILDPGDPYWGDKNDCWDDLAGATPLARHDACSSQYGAAIDESVQRDFPILQAYDDRVVLGRFGYNGPVIVSTDREVVGRDQSNVKTLQRMRCCFHNQVRFKIRTGGTWVTLGTSVGYLHRITTDPSGACVQSCFAREALLNSRAPAVPRPKDLTRDPPDRNSVLAMRNPAFSFVVWNGLGAAPQRDMQWKFTTRGQFSPLVVNIASTTTAVSPQSMKFIDSLGQLALVDGSSQGLVLIDLNTVALAHTPYF